VKQYSKIIIRTVTGSFIQHDNVEADVSSGKVVRVKLKNSTRMYPYHSIMSIEVFNDD